MMRQATGAGVAACALVLAAAVAAEPPVEGMWKSAPIPEKPAGEFGNRDVYGLAMGLAIETDCSIYWIHREQLYCFNSMTSRAFFLDSPQRYIDQARAFAAGKGGDR